jgi:hypothetical protein
VTLARWLLDELQLSEQEALRVLKRTGLREDAARAAILAASSPARALQRAILMTALAVPAQRRHRCRP